MMAGAWMLAETAPPAAPPREKARVVPMMAKLLRKLFWIIMPRRSRRSVKIWASTQPSPVSTRQVASTNQMLSR